MMPALIESARYMVPMIAQSKNTYLKLKLVSKTDVMPFIPRHRAWPAWSAPDKWYIVWCDYCGTSVDGDGPHRLEYCGDL